MLGQGVRAEALILSTRTRITFQRSSSGWLLARRANEAAPCGHQSVTVSSRMLHQALVLLVSTSLI